MGITWIGGPLTFITLSQELNGKMPETWGLSSKDRWMPAYLGRKGFITPRGEPTYSSAFKWTRWQFSCQFDLYIIRIHESLVENKKWILQNVSDLYHIVLVGLSIILMHPDFIHPNVAKKWKDGYTGSTYGILQCHNDWISA